MRGRGRNPGALAKKSLLRLRSLVPPFDSIRKIGSLAPYLASIARTRLRRFPHISTFRKQTPWFPGVSEISNDFPQLSFNLGGGQGLGPLGRVEGSSSGGDRLANVEV